LEETVAVYASNYHSREELGCRQSRFHASKRAIDFDFGENGPALRNAGFWISDSKFAYAIDKNCKPIADDLMTPSTSDYFSTLYDPFHMQSDYSRGYPYSLRNGLPTGISHGTHLGEADYDIFTRLMKHDEKNTRHKMM